MLVIVLDLSEQGRNVCSYGDRGLYRLLFLHVPCKELWDHIPWTRESDYTKLVHLLENLGNNSCSSKTVILFCELKFLIFKNGICQYISGTTFLLHIMGGHHPLLYPELILSGRSMISILLKVCDVHKEG